MITQDRLKELLTYDPATGIFRWLVARGGNRVGDRAGCFDESLGYRKIRVDGKLYYAHQLAWLYVHGVFVKEIDHRNMKGDDCWIDNLRPATRGQNTANRPPRNKLGI